MPLSFRVAAEPQRHAAVMMKRRREQLKCSFMSGD